VADQEKGVSQGRVRQCATDARCIFKLYCHHFSHSSHTPAHPPTQQLPNTTALNTKTVKHRTAWRGRVAQVNEIHLYSSAAEASDGTDNDVSSLPPTICHGTHEHTQPTALPAGGQTQASLIWVTKLLLQRSLGICKLQDT
jgi:hypothetical protein